MSTLAFRYEGVERALEAEATGRRDVVDLDAVIDAPGMVDFYAEELLRDLGDILRGTLEEVRRNVIYFCVQGNGATQFTSYMINFGKALAKNVLPVQLEYAARHFVIEGLISAFSEEGMILVTAVNAFVPDENLIVLKPSADLADVQTQNTSLALTKVGHTGSLCEMKVDELHEYDFGAMVVDCFKTTSLVDIIDLIGTATMVEDGCKPSRFAVFYMLPFDHDFFAHVIRYVALDFLLTGEDARGKIDGCGLDYFFHGQDICFTNGIITFHHDVAAYIRLVTESSVEVDLKGCTNLMIENFQIFAGILVRKVSMYDKSFSSSKETLIRYDFSCCKEHVTVYGHSLRGKSIDRKPFLVEKKLWDDAYMLVMQSQDLTLENVRLQVHPLTETITSSLGRTTQARAIGADKFEALCQTLYVRCYQDTYNATQVLRYDINVQGGERDIPEQLVKSAVTVAAVASFMSLPAVLPASLIVKGLTYSGVALGVFMGLNLTATTLIRAIANMFLVLDGWQDIVRDVELHPTSVFFESVIGCLGSGTERVSFVDGVKRVAVAESVGTKVKRITVGRYDFVAQKGGMYFDKSNVRYSLVGVTKTAEITGVATIFSNVEAPGTPFHLGDLWSNADFEGSYVDGFFMVGRKYYKEKLLCDGVVFAEVPKTLALYTFFDLTAFKTVFCVLRCVKPGSADNPVLFTNPIALRDAFSFVSSFTLERYRMREVVQNAVSAVMLSYDPCGFVEFDGPIQGDALDMVLMSDKRYLYYCRDLRFPVYKDLIIRPGLAEDFSDLISLYWFTNRSDLGRLVVDVANDMYSAFCFSPFLTYELDDDGVIRCCRKRTKRLFTYEETNRIIDRFSFMFTTEDESDDGEFSGFSPFVVTQYSAARLNAMHSVDVAASGFDVH